MGKVAAQHAAIETPVEFVLIPGILARVEKRGRQHIDITDVLGKGIAECGKQAVRKPFLNAELQRVVRRVAFTDKVVAEAGKVRIRAQQLIALDLRSSERAPGDDPEERVRYRCVQFGYS